jgi:hypothetical protein
MKEIFLPVKTALKAKGCPFELVYGPTQVPLASARRASSCRRRVSPTQLGPVRSQRANPKHVAVCAVGLVVRIFARSTKPNAQRYDHEALARQTFEAVYVASINDVVSRANTQWRPGAPRFTEDVDHARWLERRRLRVPVLRRHLVQDVNWQGEPADELTMAADTTSTTQTATGPGPSTDLPTATTRVP